QSVGQFVEVDDLHPLQLANLVQIEVVGHHTGINRLGEHDQPLVDLVDLLELGQVCFVHLQLNLLIALQPLEDVQTTPTAVSLDLVGAVGNSLQLLKHKARSDQLSIDDPRITY